VICEIDHLPDAPARMQREKSVRMDEHPLQTFEKELRQKGSYPSGDATSLLDET